MPFKQPFVSDVPAAVSFEGDVRKNLCPCPGTPPHPPPPIPGGWQSGPGGAAFPAGPAIPRPAPARSRHSGIQSPGRFKSKKPRCSGKPWGVALFSGRLHPGQPHLRAALDMQPNLGKIQALLGMVEKRTGQTAAASTDLEASFAAVTDPKLKIQIGMELVELYTASRDLEKASGIVTVMRQADPLNPAVLYTAYRIHSDLASEAMLSLALVEPDSAQMHQVMAHEEAKQGNTAAARLQFQKAAEIDPKLPGIHFELGELLGISEDAKTRAAAVTEYKAALVENPADEKAETRLGDLSSRNGDTTQALAHYNRALTLQPDDAEAEFGLAKTLIAMNQQAKALPVLERAVQLEPTNAAAHFRLSTIYREMGRTADSQHEVEEYKKYKMMKEKLEPIFKEMQLHPAGLSSEEQEAK